MALVADQATFLAPQRIAQPKITSSKPKQSATLTQRHSQLFYPTLLPSTSLLHEMQAHMNSKAWIHFCPHRLTPQSSACLLKWMPLVA